MSAGKIIASVFTIMGSCFVAVIAFAVFASGVDAIRHDAEYDNPPKVIEARAEYIGDTYLGYEQEEKKAYYRIWLTVENETNFSNNGNVVYVFFESIDTEYSLVDTIDEQTPFEVWEDAQYVPAGKKARITRIISVDETCEKIRAVWLTGDDRELEQIKIELKKG